MVETDWGWNSVLFWWVGSCTVNFLSNIILLIGISLFPSFCLTWATITNGGSNEDTVTSFKSPMHTLLYQCSWPCSRPLLTYNSVGDSSTLIGKSGSVFCGVTAPFSWVLLQTRFLSAPSKSLFSQSCVSFGGSMVGLIATSSKRTYALLMH